MSSLAQTHDEAIDSLASTYRKDGFDVLKEPRGASLPFDLGGYQPDLIATKGGAGLIIEVKTRPSPISVDRFQSIAQEVSQHPGWRFLLVTLEDVDSSKIPTTRDELPTWEQLSTRLKQVKALISEGAIEPALLYLWSVFEAALRHRAIAQNIPVERLPASTLLQHMYSQGEISVDDIDALQEFMEKRNRIAHGASEPLDKPAIEKMADSVSRLLKEWSTEGSATQAEPVSPPDLTPR